MKLQKLGGSIRGDAIPALPFIIFLVTIASIFGFSQVFRAFTGNDVKILTVKTAEEVKRVIDGEGEVVLPAGSYLFIHSCPKFVSNYEEYEGMSIEELKFDNETLERIKEKCMVKGGVVCVARRMGNGFFRVCTYTLKEPQLEEPIAMKLEEERILKTREAGGIFTKVEVV